MRPQQALAGSWQDTERARRERDQARAQATRPVSRQVPVPSVARSCLLPLGPLVGPRPHATLLLMSPPASSSSSYSLPQLRFGSCPLVKPGVNLDPGGVV